MRPLWIVADSFGNPVKKVDYDSFGNIINDCDPTNTIHLNRFSLRSTQIIQIDGIDVGRVTITRREDRIIINEIHVIPEYQSKGIGSHVIRAALSEADEDGVLVELKVLKANPAYKLYERLGFRVVCEDQQRYYMKRGK